MKTGKKKREKGKEGEKHGLVIQFLERLVGHTGQRLLLAWLLVLGRNDPALAPALSPH